MRAIDTNVILRLILRDDPQQVDSAERFIAGGAWISILALAETVWVLGTTYGFSPTAIAATIEMLLDSDQVVLQEQAVVAKAAALFRTKPSLAFSDCLLVELARAAGHLPLGTFDRNLAKLTGAHRL